MELKNTSLANNSDPWTDLIRELDIWGNRPKSLTFWWRDDDACGLTPSIRKLLKMSADCGIPLSLSAISAVIGARLADEVEKYPQVRVLQHGYAHADHEDIGEKPSEFGCIRPDGDVLAEIQKGSNRLKTLFAYCFMPVFVPPWNRMDTQFLPLLTKAGLKGLSTFGPRKLHTPIQGLCQVNTHIDLCNWKAGARFAGESKCIESAISHIAARRKGLVDEMEPTGLLTHHQYLDKQGWEFIQKFLSITDKHEATKWIDASVAFSLS